MQASLLVGDNMGNSAYQGKEWTIAFIQFSNGMFKSVLDIGPGQGTYLHYLKPIMPDSVWHGVEIFKPYIDQFDLVNRYDKIFNEDIREFTPDRDYDLVIAGDVLEHMEKHEAQEVVDKLLKVSKALLISIPIVKWEQDAINDNEHEIHVKDDWSHQEVMESFPNIKACFAGSHIGVYVLGGARW